MATLSYASGWKQGINVLKRGLPSLPHSHVCICFDTFSRTGREHLDVRGSPCCPVEKFGLVQVNESP